MLVIPRSLSGKDFLAIQTLNEQVLQLVDVKPFHIRGSEFAKE
jgi:hypothetical protein